MMGMMSIPATISNVPWKGKIEHASVISKCSDKIFMALVSSTRPESAIFRLYEESEDKDAFVAGLIGNLILRHKQWQGQGGG